MLSSLPGAVKLLIEGSNRSLWAFAGSASSASTSSSSSAVGVTDGSSGRCSPGDEEEEEGRIAGASAESSTQSAEAFSPLVSKNNKARSTPAAVKGILKPYVPPAPMEDHPQEAADPEGDEDGGPGHLAASSTPTGTSKTKRSRKRRGKNRGRSDSLDSAQEHPSSSSSTGRRALRWGFVDEVSFSRGVSMDTVPSDGSYPLGLGAEIGRSHGSVDEVQEHRNTALMERAIALGVVHSSQAAGSAEGEARSMHLVEAEAPALALETRQFDYKRGKNPLFGRLTEHDRISEFGRPRSGSADLSCSPPPSSSFLAADTATVSNATINELGKELNKIRLSRLDIGCMCRPIKLDKLSVVKMKAELTGTFGFSAADAEAMSKTELNSKLKELIQSCQLCVTNNCSCVQLEIPCSGDTCNCLKGRVRLEAQQPCSNRNGQRVFDPEKVNQYRCQFISIDNLLVKQRDKRSGSF